MKKIIAILFVQLISAHALTQDTSFVKNYRLSQSLRETGNSVMERSDGKIITGGMSNNCTGMTCENSTSISCFTAGGTELWHNKFGMSQNTVLYDLVEGNSLSTIVAGKINEDILMYKVDVNGNLVWSNGFGSDESDIVLNIVSVNNGYIGLGYSMGSNGITTFHGFLFKINENGTLLWYKRFTQSDDFSTYGLAKINDQEVLVTGSEDHISTLIKLTSDGTIIDSRQFISSLGSTPYHNAQATVVTVGNDGYFYGTLNIGSSFFIYKTDASFNLVWSKKLTTSPMFAFNCPVRIVADPTNGCWLGSNSQGDLPTWIHVSAAGDVLNAYNQPGVISGVVYGMEFAANGDLLVAGKNQITTQYNCFLARMSPTASLSCLTNYTCNTTNATLSVQNYTATIANQTTVSPTSSLIADPGIFQEDNLCYSISASSNSLEDWDAANPFSMYPNPASNELYITAEKPIQSVTLFSINGKPIQSIPVKGQYIKVALDLSPGVYLVSVDETEHHYCKTLFVN